MRLKKIIIALMTALTFYGTMNVAASTEIAEAKATKVYKSNLSKANQKAKQKASKKPNTKQAEAK